MEKKSLKHYHFTYNLYLSCSGSRGEPGWASGHLTLEHPAGVADGVVEDDVGGGGLVQHLQPGHHEHGRARLLGGNVSKR